LLPHLLTTANLAAGFYAIVKAGEGDFERAAVALIVAAVFDVLDGRAARYGQTTSRFGLEYDSIADTVSFGVAPAVLAFNAGAFYELGWTGWVMAFIYMACAALRLARFNVSPGRFPGRFEGLPSPAAAGIILTTVLFSDWLRESGLPFGVPATLVALGVALVGILMVTPIPYRSFKEARLRGSYWNVVLMVMVSTVILMRPELTLFVIAYAYAFSGPVEVIWRRRVGRPLVPIPAPGRDSDQHAEAMDHE
jgi:CDP-diacylglycerol--serine O-phosphatidyltransferase